MEVVKRTLTKPKAVLPYAVPGLIYMVNNNLEIFVLKYMDPATFRLLGNMKILTTAVLYRLVMGTAISMQQWVALVMLLLASMGGVNTSSVEGASDAEMHTTFWGVVLMIIYCCNSAAAGIGNEWILKRGEGTQFGIHLQNAVLYMWGVAFNFIGFLYWLHSFVDSDDVPPIFDFENTGQSFW